MEWHEEKRNETAQQWRAAWDYQRKLERARRLIAAHRETRSNAQQGAR